VAPSYPPPPLGAGRSSISAARSSKKSPSKSLLRSAPFTHSITHLSLTYPFTRPYIHSFTRSFSFTSSPNLLFTHSLIHPIIRSCTPILALALSHSLVHLFCFRSPLHSCTQSHMNPSTRSHIHSLIH
jgi:hypothetical protein